MTELADPETHWIEIALVAFTQTLSVGVDRPKRDSICRGLHVYAAGFGCTVRALVQGAPTPPGVQLIRFGLCSV